MDLSQGNHKLRLKNIYERENPILKIGKMTASENLDHRNCTAKL
jgi:hypothetical protein